MSDVFYIAGGGGSGNGGGGALLAEHKVGLTPGQSVSYSIGAGGAGGGGGGSGTHTGVTLHNHTGVTLHSARGDLYGSGGASWHTGSVGGGNGAGNAFDPESVRDLVSPAFHDALTALAEALALASKLRTERDELRRLLTAAEGALTYLRQNNQSQAKPAVEAGSFVNKSQHQAIGLMVP